MRHPSVPDTLDHIAHVRSLLHSIIDLLHSRARGHDQSKLASPEVETFDVWTPRLAEMEYGSQGYFDALEAMRPALEHHYARNRHHPQHFENGIADMNLLDVIEMLADWKASGARMADGGNLLRSIDMNRERFGYGEELHALLVNTARDLGWL